MTQQPYDGGDSSHDLSYDSAHEAASVVQPVTQRPHPPRSEAGRAGEPPADLSGDYSYDLAHDVPPG